MYWIFSDLYFFLWLILGWPRITLVLKVTTFVKHHGTQISKSPFHAENFFNIQPLSSCNKNLLPSNRQVLRRLIKEDSKKGTTSLKQICAQMYTELFQIWNDFDRALSQLPKNARDFKIRQIFAKCLIEMVHPKKNYWSNFYTMSGSPVHKFFRYEVVLFCSSFVCNKYIYKISWVNHIWEVKGDPISTY